MMITAIQCKMARAALGLSVRELARRAGISQSTVVAFESGKVKPNASTVSVIQRALEDGGVEFINGGQPGVRLKGK